MHTLMDSLPLLFLFLLLPASPVFGKAVASKADDVVSATDDDVGTDKVIGLYRLSDPMRLFNRSDIVPVLANNTDKVWIVEFYASWCGHCQNFAPKWLAVADSLKRWREYVSVGAIDCGNSINYAVCIKFGIRGYPTIKYFLPGWKYVAANEKIGVNKYRGPQTVGGILSATSVQAEKSFPGLKSDFLPVNGTYVKQFLGGELAEEFEHLILAFSSARFSWKVLILDASSFDNLSLRWVLNTNNTDLMETFEVTNEQPALVLVNKNGTFQHIDIGRGVTKGELMKEFSRINGEGTSETEDKNTTSSKAKPPTKKTKKVVVGEKKSQVFDQNKVYMSDLISAVTYTLHREVPKESVIRGEALQALKDWLKLLSTCLPAGRKVVQFLQSMRSHLNNTRHTDALESSDYLSYINNYQTEYPDRNYTMANEVEYKGCKGSKDRYRGFPCSLWVLFHTLTVQCADPDTSVDISGIDVILAIRGFVHHFFGCRYCADHFTQMAKNVSSNEVPTNDDAVLWLWEKHNRVNSRLRKDVSSDPRYPKFQFPSVYTCATCRYPTRVDSIVTNPRHGLQPITWGRQSVLQFLKEHYGTITT